MEIDCTDSNPKFIQYMHTILYVSIHMGTIEADESDLLSITNRYMKSLLPVDGVERHF